MSLPDFPSSNASPFQESQPFQLLPVLSPDCVTTPWVSRLSYFVTHPFLTAELACRTFSGAGPRQFFEFFFFRHKHLFRSSSASLSRAVALLQRSSPFYPLPRFKENRFFSLLVPSLAYCLTPCDDTRLPVRCSF